MANNYALHLISRNPRLASLQSMYRFAMKGTLGSSWTYVPETSKPHGGHQVLTEIYSGLETRYDEPVCLLRQRVQGTNMSHSRNRKCS